MKVLLVGLLGLATTAGTWLDPYSTAREASRLYAQGKFDAAAAKYREALLDDPDSALLHFNLGDTAYRQGKLDDAMSALGQIPASDANPARTARAAYNAGNAKYRLGAAAEATDPQKALTHYAEALVAYRRAMGADPADEDPKFNHEFVEKKIADLKKKLEEQQKKQDEQKKQQQEQPQDQQQKDQEQKDQQQKDQQPSKQNQPQDQQQKDDRQKDQQAQQDQQRAEQPKPDHEGQKPQDRQADGGEPRPGDGEKPPGDDADRRPEGQGAATADGQPTNEMSAREAEALLDGQRDQEVRPDEVVKKLQRAGVAEPQEDW